MIIWKADISDLYLKHPQIRNKIVVMGKYDLFILTFYYSRNIYNRDQIDADRRDHNSDL